MSLASELREQVRVERPVTVDDGYGGKTISWNELATVFAEVKPLSGIVNARERLVGDQREASAGYRVIIRLRTDVTAAMRIIWKTHILLIHSLHERDATLSLLCYEENI
jgi:SPP1 family predicted phage head-tail adaptor